MTHQPMEPINPEQIFPEERSDQADFEIAFTALVITVVLSVPIENGYTLLKGFVISLSVLTLLRKMAVSNDHKNPDAVLRWTMPFILSITAIALTHVLLKIGSFIVAAVGLTTSPVLVGAILIPVFVMFAFMFQEFVFHDANLYLALLCYNGAAKAEQLRIFGIEQWVPDWFLDRGGEFIAHSKVDSVPSELGWLEYRVEQDVSGSFLPFVTIGLIGYGAVWGLASWLFGSGILNIIFLAFVFLLNYPIQFWYSRFGLASFTTERSGWLEVLVVLLGLLLANVTILPNYV